MIDSTRSPKKMFGWNALSADEQGRYSDIIESEGTTNYFRYLGQTFHLSEFISNPNLGFWHSCKELPNGSKIYIHLLPDTNEIICGREVSVSVLDWIKTEVSSLEFIVSKSAQAIATTSVSDLEADELSIDIDKYEYAIELLNSLKQDIQDGKVL